MASRWGYSWQNAWGNSWGIFVGLPDPGSQQPWQQFAAGTGFGGTDYKKRSEIAAEIRAILDDIRAAKQPAAIEAAVELVADYAPLDEPDAIDWNAVAEDAAAVAGILQSIQEIQATLNAAALRADDEESIALLLMN